MRLMLCLWLLFLDGGPRNTRLGWEPSACVGVSRVVVAAPRCVRGWERVTSMAVLRYATGTVVYHWRMKSDSFWWKPTISAIVFGGSSESEDGIQN